MSNYNDNTQKGIPDYMMNLFEAFPYPLQIFSRDGTARVINNAALEMIGIRSRESHIGKYNVFKDPIVRKLGVIDQVREVLTGKTVYLTDFTASYEDMLRYYNVTERNLKLINTDITCFPLVEKNGRVEYFAKFSSSKIYMWARKKLTRQAIHKNPLEGAFDADKIAKAAYLSKSHFTKLFKIHTGITPYEYYINYKISRLKEILLDTNLHFPCICSMQYEL